MIYHFKLNAFTGDARTLLPPTPTTPSHPIPPKHDKTRTMPQNATAIYQSGSNYNSMVRLWEWRSHHLWHQKRWELLQERGTWSGKNGNDLAKKKLGWMNRISTCNIDNGAVHHQIPQLYKSETTKCSKAHPTGTVPQNLFTIIYHHSEKINILQSWE